MTCQLCNLDPSGKCVFCRTKEEATKYALGKKLDFGGDNFLLERPMKNYANPIRKNLDYLSLANQTKNNYVTGTYSVPKLLGYNPNQNNSGVKGAYK